MAIPARRADLARERIRLAASQQARARARAGLAWKHPSSGRSTRDPPLREHPIYYILCDHTTHIRATLSPPTPLESYGPGITGREPRYRGFLQKHHQFVKCKIICTLGIHQLHKRRQRSRRLHKVIKQECDGSGRVGRTVASA